MGLKLGSLTAFLSTEANNNIKLYYSTINNEMLLNFEFWTDCQSVSSQTAFNMGEHRDQVFQDRAEGKICPFIYMPLLPQILHVCSVTDSPGCVWLGTVWVLSRWPWMHSCRLMHALSLWLCPSSSSGRSTVTSRGSSLEAAAFWPFHGGLHRSGQNLQLQMLFNEVNHQISHSWIFNWQPRRYWDFSIVLELTWQIVRTRVLLRPSWSKRRGALLGCAVRSYTWTSWKEKVKEEPSLVSNSLSLPKAARLGLGIAAIASVTALADQDQRVYGRCCSGGTERHGNLIWSYLTPLHWSLPLLFSWHGGRRLLNLVDALTPPLCLCHS